MKKILVIDDEQPTLKMFTLLLEAMGFSVLTAEDGRAGVDVFRDERPDIVFTDIKMPVMDGIEVLRNIKEINPHAEVIVITGHGDMELAIQALNLDATDFINKPVQRQALSQALQRAEERLALSRTEQTQVSLEEEKDKAVLHLRGNVTGLTGTFLQSSFSRAAALGHGCIELRFDENASINGAGITTLTDLLGDFREKGGRVLITGLSENFRTVFDMVGITRLAEFGDGSH
ncbi:response regulator [Salidesulfovibrio onnuriiensis]|uniref:response regulator n=1 Tax=Salidesulfovibrio onnuriiensis TaxID=2583823 RepID=UPI0011C9E41B|nr:response regulator [Salidesulfovibrio onnuriiensis]